MIDDTTAIKILVSETLPKIEKNPLVAAYHLIDFMHGANDDCENPVRGQYMEAAGKLILKAVQHPEMPATESPGILAIAIYYGEKGDNAQIVSDLREAYQVSVAPLATVPNSPSKPAPGPAARIVTENQRATPLIAGFPMKDASVYL